MPPEWAPHEATWMGFPRDSYKDSGLTREAAQRAWARVANHISDYERVRMLCHSDDLAIAKQYLSAAIECIPVALNDAWLRDIGPTFVVEEGALLAIDWQFNGWGQNTELDWSLDDQIAAIIAQQLNIRLERSFIVNEGGGIHVSGSNWVLLTDTVQLDPQRNTNCDRDDVTQQIHGLLGTQHAIWLSKGLWRDNFLNGTKGHVDIVACFTPDGRVLLHQQQNHTHPDHALWPELVAPIEAAGFEVIPLPAPTTLRDNRDWVDYSYINHYVCNGAVLCPSFHDRCDDMAREIVTEVYPGRDILMVESRELFAMGGGIHCITQQQPQHPVQTPLY
ncbi:MAG: agmatine deiminase [Halieaceae bacterium]|nr:agmatine deiminase [Halieaceae bacterium]|tara:strand:- start:2492 stop:3493 length:1002 start_codon:yes stop_codon:yes gene_type:complete